MFRFSGCSLSTGENQLEVPAKGTEEKEKNIKILEKWLEHSTNEKKNKPHACPCSMLTKSNDKVRSYMVSGILQKLSNIYVFCDKRNLGLRVSVTFH